MQLLPMGSSPDGLISARNAVITKTPGGEVLTTTRRGWGGGIKAEGVRRLVLPGVRTCSPSEEGVLHAWTGGLVVRPRG